MKMMTDSVILILWSGGTKKAKEQMLPILMMVIKDSLGFQGESFLKPGPSRAPPQPKTTPARKHGSVAMNANSRYSP